MSVADQIKESLGPFIRIDESGDLAAFIDSITEPIEAIYGIVGEEAQDYGWSVVLDPDTCPDSALDWLAQFEGVEVTEEMTSAQKRLAIKAREGAARGRPATMVARVGRTLTGSRRVVIREREGGAYQLYVRTLASETPDPDLTLAAILAQKPAGIVLDYETVTEGTYTDLLADYATYEDIPELTYTELLTLLSET